MKPAHRSRIARFPIYPVLVTAAIVLTLFNESLSPVESLPRPVLVALLAALGIQFVLTILLRDRHRGAFVALFVILVLTGWRHIALIVLAVPIAMIVAGLIMRRVVPLLPWSRATEFLNVVGVLLAVFAGYTTWASGAFVPVAAGREGEALGGSGPDVYLILLDGYPRADTLLTDFQYDNSPFLDGMEALGFDVAEQAHSNYPYTLLTLVSMLHMQQVPSIEALDEWPGRPQDQARLVMRTMNQSPALKAFRGLGYEVVAIPSPWSTATLFAADRVLDDGTITDLEITLISQGVIPDLLADFQRTLVTDSLRTRVLASLGRTVDLARERGGPPKLVLTHLLSPHAPILFGPDGSHRRGWDCLPHCSPFESGWRYGDQTREPTIGQIEYLNGRVLAMARELVETSEEPPVIIIFSDHGHRHDLDDRDEMFRSLLLSYTPGYPGLMPNDSSPVNILTRVLNAYGGKSVALASEERYWVNPVDFRFDTMEPFGTASRQ